jgi:hypothetical protein
MTGGKAVQPEDIQAALGQLVEGGTADATCAQNNYIVVLAAHAVS